jgi:3-isopropylmalate/(R)-2-methylmalate dehydratase large subunit
MHVNQPRVLFEKIWDQHAIITNEGGQTLLFVDWLLCSEGSWLAFNILRAEGHKVRRPERVFGVADHYPSSRGPTMADLVDDERRNMITMLERNTREFGITYFGLGDRRRGIQHQVGPEQGLAQPGVIILCSDSHTSTQAALGAIAFGIGGELAHVLATQTIWQRKPKNMRIAIEGKRRMGVTAKDVILAIIAKIGAGGAVQHAIEYAGETIRDMSIEERMTVCNMSIEAGARAGIIAPDEKAFAYLKGRPYAPRGEGAWNKALAYWKSLPTDRSAQFDREVTVTTHVAPALTGE